VIIFKENKEMLKKLAALLVLTMVVASVNAATLVYDEEFGGAAATNYQPAGMTGWGNCTLDGAGHASATDLVGNGAAVGRLMASGTYTYEVALRFPNFDPTTTTTYQNTFNQVANGQVMFGLKNDQGGGNGNLRFETNNGTSGSCIKTYWPVAANGTTGPREANIYQSAFFVQPASTGYQNIKYVVGPTVQALYVNGKLVHFTRFDFTALVGAQWTLYPSIRGHEFCTYDYFRIYSGDASANSVPANLVFAETYGQTSKDKDNHWKLNGERWGNEDAQVPTGLGYSLLNNGGMNTVRHINNNTGGSPFAIATTWGSDYSLEVNLRWLTASGFGTGASAQVLAGFGSGTSGAENSERIFLRQGMSAINDVKVQTKASGGSEDYSADIVQYMTNPTGAFNKVNIVYTAPGQARVFVNDGLRVTVNKTWDVTQNLIPAMKGASDANFGPPAINEFNVYSGYKVPVELATFDAE